MRMSRSPQNGGFHSSTGGRPAAGPLALFAARPSAPVIASRPNCPSFAMVCLESGPCRQSGGTVSREFDFATLHCAAPYTKPCFPGGLPTGFLLGEESAQDQ